MRHFPKVQRMRTAGVPFRDSPWRSNPQFEESRAVLVPTSELPDSLSTGHPTILGRSQLGRSEGHATPV
jgi:hypothetical protein